MSARPLVDTELLTVTCERPDDETAILRLVGDLELFTVQSFREQAERLAREGVNRIVLDLSRLHFMDSAGISGLIWLHRRLYRAGAVAVVDPNGRHRAALELVQLTRILPVYPSVDEALDDLTG